MDESIYYSTQSKYSDPGKFSYLFDPIPNSVSEIASIVHNLVVHQDATFEFYNFKVPETKKLQPNTRYVEKILEVIICNNSSPLEGKRIPRERFIGSCRDFALLTCSILRHKKIPARVRCGFANYFHKDWYSDHWVCEYFDGQGKVWKLVDAELGNEEIKKYHIDFDPISISRDRFLVGGIAWKKAREGKLNPDNLGVKGIGVKGYWFIKADVIRDLVALNKIELLPWDYSVYIDDPFGDIKKRSKGEVDLIDTIGNITSVEKINLDEIQEVYTRNSDLKIPTQIKSYTAIGPIKVSI